MNIELNANQRKVVAAGITTLAVSVIVAAVLVFFFLMVRFFSAFNNVFLPLAVAGIAALVIEPWFEWLKLRARAPAPVALALTFLSIGIPLAGALFLFGALIVAQLGDLAERIPEWYQQLSNWIREQRPSISRLFDDHPMGERLRDTLEQPGGLFANLLQGLLNASISAGSGVVGALVSLFGWAIMPVYMAFFLLMPKLDADRVAKTMMPFFREGIRDDITYLAQEFIRLVVQFFRGQLLIALIQGVLFAIGFSLAGLQYGIVIGLVLGLLNVIPYLGSILGLAVALPLAWFQPEGGLNLFALVVLVFCVVQLIEGYLLTPKIMGDRTGLHPLAIIIAVFFWGAALQGILGMILAIPLTAFLVVAWQLVRKKYIKEVL
jgi:predicted PurR-regulated permease PerM